MCAGICVKGQNTLRLIVFYMINLTPSVCDTLPNGWLDDQLNVVTLSEQNKIILYI